MQNNVEKQQKPKKKGRKKIWIPLILLIILASGYFFIKNYYLEKFLRENLGVEFSSVHTVPLTKSIVINNLSYRDKSKKDSETFKVETLKVSLDSFSLRDKTINLNEISIDNLKIINSKGENVLSPAIEAVDPQVKLALTNNTPDIVDKAKEEVQKSLAEELAKKADEEAKKSSGGGLSGLFNSIQNSLEKRNIDASRILSAVNIDTSAIDITKLIDENMIQRQFDRILANAMKSQINEYSGQGKELLKIVEARLKEEKTNSDFWTINVKKAGLIAEVYGFKINGEVENITNRLSTQNQIPVNFKIANTGGGSVVDGGILLQTVTGNTNIVVKDFDYSKTPQIKKYISKGNIEIVDKTAIEKGNFEQKGTINLSDLKLNTDSIIDEIVKAQGISKNDVRMKLVEFALQEVRELEIDYTYNSITDKLELQTNIISELRRILRENKDNLLK